MWTFKDASWWVTIETAQVRNIETFDHQRDPIAGKEQWKDGHWEQEASQGKVVPYEASLVPIKNQLWWEDTANAVLPREVHGLVAWKIKEVTQDKTNDPLILALTRMWGPSSPARLRIGEVQVNEEPSGSPEGKNLALPAIICRIETNVQREDPSLKVIHLNKRTLSQIHWDLQANPCRKLEPERHALRQGDRTSAIRLRSVESPLILIFSNP